MNSTNDSNIQTTQIWCVGRNYRDHALELKNEVPTSPVIFIKSLGTLTQDSELTLPYPAELIHHEVELVVRLGDDLLPQWIAVGLDLTHRNLQNQLKEKGLPWTPAKSFRNSACISEWITLPNNVNWHDFQLQLKVDKAERQQGSSADWVFSMDLILSHLKSVYPIRPYDLIFTGTPSGVGALHKGAKLQGLLNYQNAPYCQGQWTVN